MHICSSRFTENSPILLALSASQNMDLKSLIPLESIGLKIPNESELQTAKSYVETKRKETGKANFILEILDPVKAAFPDVYRLYTAINTFGCSTAINESSFSCLSRIDVVKRMSMSTKRECDLTLLAYNREILENISDDHILNKFNAPNRRITF